MLSRTARCAAARWARVNNPSSASACRLRPPQATAPQLGRWWSPRRCASSAGGGGRGGAFNRLVDRLSPDASSDEGFLETIRPLLPYMVVAGGVLAAAGTYKQFSKAQPTSVAADEALTAAKANISIRQHMGISDGSEMAAGSVRFEEKTGTDFDPSVVGFPGSLPADTAYFEVSFLAAPAANLSSQQPDSGSNQGQNSASHDDASKDVKLIARGVYRPAEGPKSWQALHIFAVCRDGSVIHVVDERGHEYGHVSVASSPVPVVAATGAAAQNTTAVDGVGADEAGAVRAAAGGDNADDAKEPFFNLPSTTYLAWIVAGAVIGVSIAALLMRIKAGHGSGPGGSAVPTGLSRQLLQQARSDVAANPAARQLLGEPVKCKDYFKYKGNTRINTQITRLSGKFSFDVAGPQADGFVDVSMVQSGDGAWRYVKLMLELDDTVAGGPKRVNLAPGSSNGCIDSGGGDDDDDNGGDDATDSSHLKPKAKTGKKQRKQQKRKTKNKGKPRRH